MKKIFSLLVLSVVLSLCACEGSSGLNITSEKDAVGTYKSVGIFFDREYYLNENTSFETSDGKKGTFSVFRKNEIRIKEKNEPEDIWTKKDNYFYSTDSNCLTKVYKKDTEYELKPTFDSNGRSNQAFKTGEGDQFNYSFDFNLYLSDDGTFVVENKKINKQTLSYEYDEKYEGTYKYEDGVLLLLHDGIEYPMLLIEDKLFFDIIEKVE